MFVYEDDLHAFSPYAIAKAKTTITLPSRTPRPFCCLAFLLRRLFLRSLAGTIESRTADGNSAVSGNKVTYGPYTSIAPFSTAPLRLHYVNNAPMLVVEKLRRVIEVSHWGSNLAVEDHYRIYHAGAQLNELFSRNDFQHKQYQGGLADTSVLRGLSFVLPAGATDVYYRDTIGNISTSNFRPGLSSSQLDIQTRYPVYGGWHASFFIGYNAPLPSFLRLTADGQYCLSLQLLNTFKNAAIDELEVQIRLPEGASYVGLFSRVNFSFFSRD